MRLTYKYRLFPTKAQRTALQNSLDACRFVYNKTLEVRRNAWNERQKSLSRYDTIRMIPELKAEHEFLTNAYSQSLQEACTRVDLAFKAFFRRVKAGAKPSYPRFKGRYYYDSFTYPQDNGSFKKATIRPAITLLRIVCFSFDTFVTTSTTQTKKPFHTSSNSNLIIVL